MFTKAQQVRPTETYYDHLRARIRPRRGSVLRQSRSNPSWYIVKWDEKRTPETLHEKWIEPLPEFPNA